MASNADITVRFGKRLASLRKERGLTQDQFAAKSGLNRTYLSDVERGARNVSLRNIEVISITLGMSLAELMRGVSESRRMSLSPEV